jgi:hypothetical protein
MARRPGPGEDRGHDGVPGPIGEVTSRFDPALVAGLDEPVRRFFAHAIAPGTPVPESVRIRMHGSVDVGRWVPFTAEQETARDRFAWRARVGIGPITAVRVLDRFAEGTGLMDVRLLGRVPVVHADDANTARSAAGRAALEAATFAPALLLPDRGVAWHALADDHLVATWTVGPERPEVHVRVDARGAPRAVHGLRWDRKGTEHHQYLPCGCEVHGERRFGGLTVPAAVTVSWWYGTDREAPFFRAVLDALTPVVV